MPAFPAPLDHGDTCAEDTEDEAAYKKGHSLLPPDAAIKLSPKKFEYAADRAEAFLDLIPFPHAEAIRAWQATLAIAETPDERDWAYLQTAIAHFKGEQWKHVSSTLKRMTGEHHQALASQLRRATEAKLNEPKP